MVRPAVNTFRHCHACWLLENVRQCDYITTMDRNGWTDNRDRLEHNYSHTKTSRDREKGIIGPPQSLYRCWNSLCPNLLEICKNKWRKNLCLGPVHLMWTEWPVCCFMTPNFYDLPVKSTFRLQQHPYNCGLPCLLIDQTGAMKLRTGYIGHIGV